MTLDEHFEYDIELSYFEQARLQFKLRLQRQLCIIYFLLNMKIVKGNTTYALLKSSSVLVAFCLLCLLLLDQTSFLLVGVFQHFPVLSLDIEVNCVCR